MPFSPSFSAKRLEPSDLKTVPRKRKIEPKLVSPKKKKIKVKKAS